MSKVKRSFLLNSGIFQAFASVLNTLYHLCLSACCFYLFFSACRKDCCFNSYFVGELTVAENLELILVSLDDSAVAKDLKINNSAVLELSESAYVYNSVLSCKTVVEASLGKLSVKGQLAALKSGSNSATGARVLTLVSLAGSLAVTGTRTPALAVRSLNRAGGG